MIHYGMTKTARASALARVSPHEPAGSGATVNALAAGPTYTENTDWMWAEAMPALVGITPVSEIEAAFIRDFPADL